MQSDSSRSAVSMYGVVLWAVAGIELYMLAGIATLFSIALIEGAGLPPVGIDLGAGTVGLSIRNGLHTIAWGALAVVIAMPVGRRLVPGLAFGAIGWIVLATGLGLAAITTTLVDEFVRARYVSFDPEYAGLAIFAGPALVAIALASWAALAVPRGAGLALVAASVTAVACLAFALLPSVAGAGDGIDPESRPIVAGFITDVVYAAAASMLVIRGSLDRATGSTPG